VILRSDGLIVANNHARTAAGTSTAMSGRRTSYLTTAVEVAGGRR
jgi:hypothetical protein